MPIMQIVRVITVFNRRMAAIRAVYMLVVSVFVTVCAHSTMVNLGFLIVQQNRQQRLVSHRHIHRAHSPPLIFLLPSACQSTLEHSTTNEGLEQIEVPKPDEV